MSRRIDYFDDPAAPPANSVVPSASAFVLRDNRLLLISRSDNDNWAMPGGAHDPGESLPQTAVRETFEESGVTVRPVGLVGLFTDPRHLIHYTSDDEVRQEFTIVFRAEYVSGQPTPSEESLQVEWIPVDQIDALPMDRSQRKRIRWGLDHPDQTWIDPTGD